jgi:hypothetical protein
MNCRDLLLRHEKLVHDIESNRYPRRSSAAANVAVATHMTGHSFIEAELQSIDTSSQVSMQTDWASQDPASLLSNAEHQYASSDGHDAQLPQAGFLFGQIEQQQPENISTLAPSIGNPHYGMIGPAEVPGDYNLFFDNFDISNFYLPATVFDSELPISLWSRPISGGDVGPDNVSKHVPSSQNEHDALSRFGSRLPSLRPEEQNLMDSEPSPQADFLRAGPPWKVSGQDHRKVQLKLKEFACVLPEDFSLPSRHTLSRFFEGYISGFHQHLPFLHIPSFAVSKCVPELVLAIAAVGAQYRFESTKGNKLWYAAKAVAAEQIRRRHSQHVADILLSPTPRFASVRKSPASHCEPENSNGVGLTSAHSQEAARLSSDPR